MSSLCDGRCAAKKQAEASNCDEALELATSGRTEALRLLEKCKTNANEKEQIIGAAISEVEKVISELAEDETKANEAKDSIKAREVAKLVRGYSNELTVVKEKLDKALKFSHEDGTDINDSTNETEQQNTPDSSMEVKESYCRLSRKMEIYRIVSTILFIVSIGMLLVIFIVPPISTTFPLATNIPPINY